MPQDNEQKPQTNAPTATADNTVLDARGQLLATEQKRPEYGTAAYDGGPNAPLRQMSAAALGKGAADAPHDQIMQFFEYAHLPPKLQDVSKAFHAVAWWVEANVPRNPERTVALRKLLEGKDAAVRAAICK